MKITIQYDPEVHGTRPNWIMSIRGAEGTLIAGKTYVLAEANVEDADSEREWVASLPEWRKPEGFKVSR